MFHAAPSCVLVLVLVLSGCGGPKRDVPNPEPPTLADPPTDDQAREPAPREAAAGGEDTSPALRKLLEQHAEQLQDCYARELDLHPTLEGRIVVRWEVEDGRARDIEGVVNTTGDPDLADCVTGQIGLWQYPAELNGPVEWPFVFRQKRP